MEKDLIPRYIYAVTRHLPQNMRSDVEKELDSLIADMLLERCGDVVPTEDDVKVVLTELGSPEKLAEKYSGEERRALISGVIFLYYKQILKIVLPIVVSIVTVVSIITQVMYWDPLGNPFTQFGLAAGSVLAGIFSALIFPFAIITFIFAIFERYNVKLDEGDIFSRLPDLPEKAEKIKISEAVAGIVFCVVFAVVLLAFPQVIGMWTQETGWIPVFEITVFRSLWLFIVLWAIFEIIKESVKIIEREHTKRLLVVTIVCNILIMACAVIVFMNGKIMNPEFLYTLNNFITDEDGRTAASVIFGNLNYIIVGAAILGLFVDIIVAAVNTYKTRKEL